MNPDGGDREARRSKTQNDIMKFEIHTLDTAPEASKPTLAGVQKAYTFIPNLMGTLAESPLAAEAYFQLSGMIEGKSTLTPAERQAAMLAVSFENGCDYCVAAHSGGGAKAGLPAATIQALRDGKPPADGRTAALVAFTRAVVHDRGWVKEAALEAFLAAGFNRAQVLEVIVITALKTISNYTNHLSEPPLDAAFAGQKWTRPD